ncbi:glycosyltransferase family 39 protein [Synechococcus sp. GreenBA-s]|nr:glycosyltransferase family 39 protein [Synechococcus sp. GreenBA-s]
MLLLVAGCGVLLFLLGLGDTGLVDETPPLFAAAARAMAETGDWLTPRVNGLPRYDKPPLVYWLMGLGYLLPGQAQWNPLGTWAARLPSALSSLAVMLALAATLWRWPQPSGQALPGERQRGLTALAAALAFALSPLVLLWSRIAVSDALFSGCVALALLLLWRRFATSGAEGGGGGRWWLGWLVLGLAVLAKGPVAVVLAAITLALFAWRSGQAARLRQRLRPLAGLAVTAAVALPWYGLELLVEGQPFWDSFFGYHNLQRFTAVVNHHLQPWWFFAPVLVVASLPFTPLLLAGLVAAFRQRGPLDPARSLRLFAGCWLLAVLGFFTLAATKLPSYWIPATPAAGLLMALAAQDLALQVPVGAGQRWGRRAVMGSSLALVAVLAVGLAASPLWIPLIRDPEMPTLPAELLASGLVLRASACFALALLLGLALWRRPWRGAWLVALQAPLLLFVVAALQPMTLLGDRVRQLPVRRVAAAVLAERRPAEPLAMVGILKPSLHYYTRQVVLYEGIAPVGLLNLDDRLARERRRGQEPTPPRAGSSLLVVIDQGTAHLPHWRGLPHERLGSEGLYQLWRVPRPALQRRAAQLRRAGVPAPDWQLPRPERY